MDSEKIEELLQKYWNCETTLEEEERLRAYFKNAQLPETSKDTAALFRYFDEQKGRGMTDISFEKKLIRKIREPKGKMGTLLFNSMRIAAGIAVLIVAIWLVRMEVRKGSPAEADTFDDPKMAFEETKKALMMISKSFSTAEEHARKIQLFNEAQEDVSKETTEAEL